MLCGSKVERSRRTRSKPGSFLKQRKRKMQNILLLKGLPASGKSTWAITEVKNNPNKYKRINKDDLRAMLDASYWSRSNEEFILKIQEHIISAALKNGKDIIIDDTNLDDKHFNRICLVAESSNRDITISEKYFPIDLNLAIERDSKRANPVTEKVIRGFYNRYIKNKTISERSKCFTAKYTKKYEFNNELSNAIICDLDGTLALLNGRSPYDASSCEEDLVNESVLETLISMYEAGYSIIFVSGRDGKYELQTKAFLKKHISFPYVLFMRKSGDQRPDQTIKREIFEDHIRDKFNVLFVIDDRPKVVRMWRHDLGLTAYQLNDVEF
jgi:predicted kinase